MSDETDLQMAECPDDTGLDYVSLSTRSRNCLKNNGYKTVGDIRHTPDQEMLRMCNFGKVSLKELRVHFGPFTPRHDHPRSTDRVAAVGMNKRDEAARVIDPFGWALHDEEPNNPRFSVEDSQQKADAIFALLAEPDNRMVEAAQRATAIVFRDDETQRTVEELPREIIETVIRAAMKAATI